MNTAIDVVFLINVAWILIHELDAIQQHEWRFCFTPTSVSDETAYRAFTALHAPLFVSVLWNVESTLFQIGFDTFVIVHAILHVMLRTHPEIAFDNWFSGIWIYGGALLGALHLLLVLTL